MHKPGTKIWSQMAVFALLFAMQACRTPPPAGPPAECKKVEKVGLRLEANRLLNPDREGNPRSVVVRLYQLEGADSFQRAGFDDIWATTAAPSVVAGPDELTLIPGRVENRAMVSNAKATHLAVAAKFRLVQESPGFRAVVPLPAPGDPCGPNGDVIALQAYLSNYAVQLQ